MNRFRQGIAILALLSLLTSISSVHAVRPANPQDLTSSVLFYGDLREDLSVSAVLEGNTNTPQLDRVYVGFDPNGYLIYDFGQPVSRVRVFNNIDHYNFAAGGDSLTDGCGKEYSLWASNDVAPASFFEIYTATAIIGTFDTGIYHSYDCTFTSQGAGTLITTYTDGWYTADPSVVIDDYVADFELNSAYRYIIIKCVSAAVADCDPEIDAIGALRIPERVPETLAPTPLMIAVVMGLILVVRVVPTRYGQRRSESV